MQREALDKQRSGLERQGSRGGGGGRDYQRGPPPPA
jgi:hypothetical protein